MKLTININKEITMKTDYTKTQKPYHIEARELGIENFEKIKGIKYPRTIAAIDLRKMWDYRAAGIKIDAARDLVEKWQRRSYHNKPCQPSGGRITIMLEIARRNQASYKAKLNEIMSLEDGALSWSHTRIRREVGTRSIVTVYHQDAEWSDKQSYRYPTSTSTWCTSHLLRPDVPGTIEAYKMNTYNILPAATEKEIRHDLRGNWRIKTIIDLLNVSPERQRGLAHVQLDPHYRVAKIRTLAGVEIWKRTLAGEIVDYCAVIGKDTYHAATQHEAVRGLATKLAAPGSRRETIDMAYALSLGFCRSGVEQFAGDNALDPEATYTRAQIIAAARPRKEENLATFGRELAKAGISL